MAADEKIIIACTAPHHGGGLGQHFSYFVELARSQGKLLSYFTPRPKPQDAAGVRVVDAVTPWLMRYTPLRFYPGAISHRINEQFDKAVAKLLPRPESACVFMGFNGQALRCFQRARDLGYSRLEIIAGNSHVLNVRRQHELAFKAYPIEKSWLSSAQVKKTLREYEMADVIHVPSEYTRQTFLKEGFPQQRLSRIHYPPDPRFVPPARKPADGVFRIVYCGTLSVFKGVPVLIEAFGKLRDSRARLTLVGGSGTRGMRRYLERALAADPRIQIKPGDPLPHLQQADVYVHPSYEDNLPYAAAEAHACGLTMILTENTGMKEFIRPGENGLVVPTGNVDALYQSLQALRPNQP